MNGDEGGFRGLGDKQQQEEGDGAQLQEENPSHRINEHAVFEHLNSPKTQSNPKTQTICKLFTLQ